MVYCEKLDLILPLRLRKALAIFFGVVEMLFFGGVIFGFNALIPVLQKEGIYSHLCGENATIGCSNQVAMYGYAFTTFMVAQMAMLFVVGFLVDHVGLRIVKICSSIIFSVGAVLFAVTTSDNSWLIFPSGSLMCVGGMANLICDFAYSKLFDKTSVFVLAFITGSYDAASSIFALVALGYDAGFSYKLIFYLLAGIGLAMNTFSSLFIVTYRLSDMSMFLPREHMNPIENGNKKVDELGDTDGECSEDQLKKSSRQEEVSDILRGYYPTVLSSLRSFPFILITLFFCFAMVRFTFFLTQFGVLTTTHFPNEPEIHRHLAQVLSFALAGGILAGMGCGFTIDYLRARIQPALTTGLNLGAKSNVYWLRLCPHAVAMLVVTASAACLSVLVFFPYVNVYYVNYFILVVMRGFLFSTISSFIMTAFPIEQFGTLYGISGSLAGAFSCIQYSLLSPSTNIANGICCIFIPFMGSVPTIILINGLRSWKRRK